MYKILCYDNLIEAEIQSVETLELAEEFVSDYLIGKTLVDEEHPCSDDVFYSSEVAYLEVYDEYDMFDYDEDGEPMGLKSPIFSSPYFYTR